MEETREGRPLHMQRGAPAVEYGHSVDIKRAERARGGDSGCSGTDDRNALVAQRGTVQRVERSNQVERATLLRVERHASLGATADYVYRQFIELASG